MKFYIVDVFAEQKYQGNQLAVFIHDGVTSDSEMQQIAREVNFSETTFIMSDRQEGGGYHVRIFTPDSEIPFAGHPTLGTAWVIRNFISDGAGNEILLNLEVGTIPVIVEGDLLTMTQNQPEFGMVIDDIEAVSGVLGISADEIRDDLPAQLVSTGLPCIIVPLRSLDTLKRCAINHARFQSFIDTYYKCNLLVFAPGEQPEPDLRVRVFMDDMGFGEDPATGSANGNLAGYLLQYNFFPNSHIKYTVGQGHEIGRPSLIRVEAAKSGDTYRIMVGGAVRFVAEGDWGISAERS